MSTVTFEEVKVTRRKTGRCGHCGKRVTRSKTFMQTVNPFNVKAPGVPKTRDEVRSDVCTEANRWSDAPVDCGCYRVTP
jgi:hypothetical protein